MKSFQMKKIAASTIVAAVMFAAAMPASHAATLGPTNFDVNVDLGAVCQLVAGPAPVLSFGTYSAFGAASNPAPSATIGIQCTRSLAAPTFAFDGATGYGVLAGLNYNVTAGSAITTAGNPATAVLGGVGTPTVHTITLSGSMAGGQAGDCGGLSEAACAGVQTATRTVTITY